MKNDDRPDFAKRLMKARKSRGFSTAKAAANFFGWNYDTYHYHESGKRGIGKVAKRYANAFRVTESWLLTGEGEAPETPKVPIYGYAAGSFDGFNVIDINPIAQIGRPPALEDVDDAYAVYVRGESMEPRFFNGDPLFVHPRQAPNPGDAVIIQTYNGRDLPAVFVKTFLRMQKDQIICKQYNPPQDFVFDKRDVLAMHRVIPNRELFRM
jgi:phage repressor protein C with HTH and peptisase S24 domain